MDMFKNSDHNLKYLKKLFKSYNLKGKIEFLQKYFKYMRKLYKGYDNLKK